MVTAAVASVLIIVEQRGFILRLPFIVVMIFRSFIYALIILAGFSFFRKINLIVDMSLLFNSFIHSLTQFTSRPTLAPASPQLSTLASASPPLMARAVNLASVNYQMGARKIWRKIALTGFDIALS